MANPQFSGTKPVSCIKTLVEHPPSIGCMQRGGLAILEVLLAYNVGSPG